LSAWVLPVWNVASWSAVRCIVRCVVSVGNVFRSGSSSEGHHSKRTLHKSVYLSARLKLRGTNSSRTCRVPASSRTVESPSENHRILEPNSAMEPTSPCVLLPEPLRAATVQGSRLMSTMQQSLVHKRNVLSQLLSVTFYASFSN
jgi:hypothetical protein